MTFGYKELVRWRQRIGWARRPNENSLYRIGWIRKPRWQG